MANGTLESFPASAIALQCVACRALVKGIVCYCGEDVCLPCLHEHQKLCAYTLHGLFRSDEQARKKGKR